MSGKRVSASQAERADENHGGNSSDAEPLATVLGTAEIGAAPGYTATGPPENRPAPWGPRQLIAELLAARRRLARQRLRLATRYGVPDDVHVAGIEAYDAIIAEIDTHVRGVEVTIAEAEEVAG